MRRALVICADRREGMAWVSANGGYGVEHTLVTPRLPDTARGMTVQSLHVTDQMRSHPKLASLREVCEPALYLSTK